MLGRGGMGIVYKAHSLTYDRLVTLKMILSGTGAAFLELARFRIEAEATTRSWWRFWHERRVELRRETSGPAGALQDPDSRR